MRAIVHNWVGDRTAQDASACVSGRCFHIRLSRIAEGW